MVQRCFRLGRRVGIALNRKGRQGRYAEDAKKIGEAEWLLLRSSLSEGNWRARTWVTRSPTPTPRADFLCLLVLHLGAGSGLNKAVDPEEQYGAQN
jgi:hypothetical protein